MSRSPLLLAGVATLGLALAVTAWADPQTGQAPAARPAPPQATGAVEGLPMDLKPLHMAGNGLTVADLPGMRAWYEKILGMKFVQQFPATGEPREFVLSMNPADPNATILALLKGARQPGATTFGRVIMAMPNSDKAAAFLMTHGITARKVSEGAYFIQDPEGNNIELYTPPGTAK